MEGVPKQGKADIISNGGDKIRFILREGEPIGSFYGYKTDGLYTQEEIDAGRFYTFGRIPNAGDIKYVPQREDVKYYGDLETAVSGNGDILKNHTVATAIGAHSWQVSHFWIKPV